MIKPFSYTDYVGDETFLVDYNSYQEKWATQIRESDKILISLVKNYIDEKKLTHVTRIQFVC